jgi:hypothetical protein
MQRLEVTRSGTASITSCGSRSVGRDDGQRARDHVHILIGIPPHVSVSRAVQYLKGKSSHKLLSEYKSLRKRYWGQHLWGRGYWVATSGNVPDEVWKKYIEDQKPEVPDDHFNVVQQVGPCCGPPNPAFSRNPKPPPLGGGEFTKAVMQDRLSRVRESARRRRRPGVTYAPRLLEWRLIGLPGFEGEVRDPSRRRASPNGWPPSPAKRLFVPFRVQDDFAEIDAFVFRVP